MNSITITTEEYQNLIDSRDHAIAMRDVANGAPLLTEKEALDYLAAPTPLAFWRRHRGLSQEQLAKAVHISQAYLAQIETGKRTGAIGIYASLARALGLRIEDLLPEEDQANIPPDCS